MRSPHAHRPLSPDITIGKRFGHLVVKARVSAPDARAAGLPRGYWLSVCDCGNETRHYSATILTAGRAKSCGCMPPSPPKARKKRRAYKPRPHLMIDLVGQRFGKLTVSGLARLDPKQGAIWRVLCDCGKDSSARAKDLKNGNTASCGCLKNVAGGRKSFRTIEIARPWRPAP